MSQPLVNSETVLAAVRGSMPTGITQKQVLAVFCEGSGLSVEDIGTVTQTTSRILSDLAREGTLDDSGRFEGTQQRVYKLPATKLAGRGKRTEQLEAEVAKLKERVKAIEAARDSVCDQRDRWRERAEEAEAKLAELLGTQKSAVGA